MYERYIDWLPLACPELGTWPATQAYALIGNQTSDLLVHRPMLNLLSHTSQGWSAIGASYSTVCSVGPISGWLPDLLLSP